MFEDSERGARRAALRRGGDRTPRFKTVVRTDAVVANSRGLQMSAQLSNALLDTIAEEMPDEERKEAVRAAATARQQVSEAYGDDDHSIDVHGGEDEAAQCKQRHRERRAAMRRPPVAWPTCGTHKPIAAFVSSTARLAALASCFATKHRSQEHVENDVTEAIIDAQFQLGEAYAALDDDVFSIDAHPEAMAAARIAYRRSRQLVELAVTDQCGEVFASAAFVAARGAFVDGAMHFNTLYLGVPLLDTELGVEWSAPIVVDQSADHANAVLQDVASKVRTSTDAMLVSNAVAAAYSRVVRLRAAVARGERESEWGDELHMATIAESHARIASALYAVGLRCDKDVLTNHRMRVRRHLDRAISPAAASNPVHEPVGASTELQLCDWVAHAERTGEADFEVIGGFGVGLDGSFNFSEPSEAGSAEWLTLRARTTSALLDTDEYRCQLARSSATAAWRCMSYDAGTYDAPFFRPSADHLEAAARFGIALCGRGNVNGGGFDVDAGILHIDPSVAAHVRSGNNVLLVDASVAMGFMFGDDEIASALLDPQNGVFLQPTECAPPHPKVSFSSVSQALPTELEAAAASPIPRSPVRADRLPAEPIGDVYRRVMHATEAAQPLAPPEASLVQPVVRPDADRASAALRSAVGAVLKTSPLAMDAVVQRITDTSTVWHVTRLPSASAVLHARQAEYVSGLPPRRLYASLGGHGARHSDVAASRLGLIDVASLFDDDDLLDRGGDGDGDDEQSSETSSASSQAVRESVIDAMAIDGASSVDLGVGVYFGIAPGALDPVAGAALLASTTRRLAVSGSAFTGWQFQRSAMS